jgi:hypothetical protein
MCLSAIQLFITRPAFKSKSLIVINIMTRGNSYGTFVKKLIYWKYFIHEERKKVKFDQFG